MGCMVNKKQVFIQKYDLLEGFLAFSFQNVSKNYFHLKSMEMESKVALWYTNPSSLDIYVTTFESCSMASFDICRGPM